MKEIMKRKNMKLNIIIMTHDDNDNDTASADKIDSDEMIKLKEI